MNGYMKTVYFGDYSVNLWVHVPKDAPLSDRIKAEAEAISDACNVVLSPYGMRVKKAK